LQTGTYYRAFRASVNGFTCWMLVMAGITVLPISPLLGVGLFIAGLDAFIDVLTALGMKFKESERIILSVLNYFTEGSAVIVGSFLLMYGILYYQYFESWFFRSLTLIGGITVVCALIDLITQRAPEIKVSKRMIGQRDRYVVLKD